MELSDDAVLVATVIVIGSEEPEGVNLAPNGMQAFVTCEENGNLFVIDVAQRKLLASIVVGIRPWGIALSPDGQRLYTANGPSNDVSAVDLETQKEIKKIKTAGGPWGLAVGPILEA